MPLEKFVSKDSQGNIERKEAGGLKKELKERVQRELEIRSEIREKHKALKEKRIKLAKDEVNSEDKTDDLKEKGIKKLDKKNRKERLKTYKEGLNDKSNAEFRDEAFEEITDFKFSKEVFNHESGWLADYQLNADKQSQSLEEFVLIKQYEELDKIRVTLMEARVEDLVPKLYSDLNAEKAKDKNNNISANIELFFKNNSAEIANLFQEDSENTVEQKKKLYKNFKDTVFSDFDKLDSAQEYLISNFFDSLINDYASMVVAQEKIKKLNPTMVSLLLKSDLTEEEWENLLKKEAEEQAKKMAEDKLLEKQLVSISSSSIGSSNPEMLYYGGSVADKLDKDSSIQIVPLGKGEYKIVFPSNDGSQEARFSVKLVKENGLSRNVFIFKDGLMDRPIITGESGFKAQVNGLYLDHAMNESIKKGKDYLGPDLNDILKDQQMYELGELLFYPVRLGEKNLNKEQINVFKKLMLVLTSKENNQKGEGIYGNLMAIKNRLSLLNLALSLNSGAKAKEFYNYLKTLNEQSAKATSIESLCKLLAVPKNSGNYTKK
jgi:hypothetical protein